MKEERGNVMTRRKRLSPAANVTKGGCCSLSLSFQQRQSTSLSLSLSLFLLSLISTSSGSSSTSLTCQCHHHSVPPCNFLPFLILHFLCSTIPSSLLSLLFFPLFFHFSEKKVLLSTKYFKCTHHVKSE